MAKTCIQCDRVWLNARLFSPFGDKAPLHGMIAARNGRIVFAGPMGSAPQFESDQTDDCEGRLITAGLIDCHTHLVYGGNRAQEFAQRLGGASYQDIARSGGGIVSTMRATRQASEGELLAAALGRLDRLIAEGVTTIEVKSGYGLSYEHEVKSLRVARQLGEERPVSVRTTLLGAHAVPPEFAGRADDYVALICDQIIPDVARLGLADAVDAFCERIAFSPDQIARVFQAAQCAGLPVKLHADQLSNGQGAKLAADYRALSADHLEYADADGILAMRAAGTVAVLLPGAYYFTRETVPPPVQQLRDAGVPIALATDCNPGTSPLTSLLLAMNMAATLFRLTVDECLAGVTTNAARALGLSDQVGTLAAGTWCDLAIWDVDDPAELVYTIGGNPLHRRIWRGQ